MSRTRHRMVAILLAAAIACWVGQAEARPRLVFRTAAVVPDPNGQLLCIVRANSAVEIDVTTRIVGTAGQNLVEYDSTLVVSPIGTDDGRYHVEQDSGTTRDDARYCEVSVLGGRKNDLRIGVTLESRDGSGALLESTHVP